MDYTLIPTYFKKELKAQLEDKLEPQFLSFFKENSAYFQSKMALTQYIVDSIYTALELEKQTPSGKSAKPPLPLLPGLTIYVCGAINGEPERAISAAAAIEFLLRASILLDDVQDQDRPEGLAVKLGISEAQNIALIMIQMGQANLLSALKVAGLAESFCLELFMELSKTIICASKGQILDLLEVKLTLNQRINDPEYFLKKATFKTAATVGFLTQLGAAIGTGIRTETTDIYRDFGLSFGMVLHLFNDLKDFVLGLENNGRDLKTRQLTLPVIYAYQELNSKEDQAAFLEMWSTPSSSEDNHRKLLELLRNTFAIPQVLGQASRYMAQAETSLKLLDPGLVKPEHQMMLASLKELLVQFQYLFSRFNGFKP